MMKAATAPDAKYRSAGASARDTHTHTSARDTTHTHATAWLVGPDRAGIYYHYNRTSFAEAHHVRVCWQAMTARRARRVGDGNICAYAFLHCALAGNNSNTCTCPNSARGERDTTHTHGGRQQ